MKCTGDLWSKSSKKIVVAASQVAWMKKTTKVAQEIKV